MISSPATRTRIVPPQPPARGPARAGWLAGLPVLALVWAGATLMAAPGIAARVAAEGARVAAGTGDATGEPWLRVEVRGRDLVALGEAPDVAERAAALARLAALDGPRRIVSEAGVVETASPFVWTAARTTAGIGLDGNRPVEIGRRALEARVASGLGLAVEDAARAARGAPPNFAQAAAFLAAQLPNLMRGGRVSLSDTVLSVTGEAPDVAAYDTLRAALARPPEGYSLGRVEILPPIVRDYRFTLSRSAAGVALDGFVPSETARAAALRAAAGLAEGGTVEDGLHTARGLPEGVGPDALVAFMAEFGRLLQSGRVAYAAGAVSVEGDATDAQAIPDARALMRDARPAGVAAGPVTLAARPLSPYRVSLRRTADGVTVNGHLPDAAARERVLAALRPRLFREPVIDRARLADGAPPGLVAALEAAAPLLATLAEGEVSVLDRTLRLTGESLYPESAARAGEKLAAALPDGWAGTAAVLPRQPAERRDAESCREGFAHAAGGADIRFPMGSAALAPAFYPALDALAALARVCPTLRIAVSGPADPPRSDPTRTDPARSAGRPPPAARDEGRGDAGREPRGIAGAPVKGASQAASAGPGSVPAEGGSRGGGAGSGRGGGRSDAKIGPPADGRVSARTGAMPAEAKSTEGKSADAKASDEAPATDLPRQRALALVEYLLQAGARMDQVSPGPEGGAGRAAFVLIP